MAVLSTTILHTVALVSLITFSAPVLGHMKDRHCEDYDQMLHLKTLPLGHYSILISSLISTVFGLTKAIKETTYSVTYLLNVLLQRE